MVSTNSNTAQAAWVAIGNLFSIGMAIVSAMILSRYLSKEEYGLYKQVLFVYNSLLSLFTLGLPRAFSYFLPKTPINEAKSLIRKMNVLFFALGGSLSLILFFCASLLEKILNAQGLAVMLRIFSPVPLLMMPTLGLDGILATYRQTKFLAVYTFLTRLAMLLCICLPTMLWNVGCKGAVTGFVISSVITFLLAWYFKYYPVKGAGNNPTKENYSSIFRFCIPLFVASIWGIIINSTDQFFISRYFGNMVFADFSNGAFELPFVGIVVSSAATVLTPVFTKEMHQGGDFRKTIMPIWESALTKGAMIIYPITIFCLFEAQNIMVALYGERYIGSTAFFQIKLFNYFTKIIIFNIIFIAINKVNAYQRIFFFYCIILIGAEYICVSVHPNPYAVTAIHTAMSILSCVCMMVYIAKQFKLPPLAFIPKSKFLRVLLVSLIACYSMYLLKSNIYPNINNTWLTLIIDSIVVSVIFFPLSKIARLDYFGIIKPLFNK